MPRAPFALTITLAALAFGAADARAEFRIGGYFDPSFDDELRGVVSEPQAKDLEEQLEFISGAKLKRTRKTVEVVLDDGPADLEYWEVDFSKSSDRRASDGETAGHRLIRELIASDHVVTLGIQATEAAKGEGGITFLHDPGSWYTIQKVQTRARAAFGSKTGHGDGNGAIVLVSSAEGDVLILAHELIHGWHAQKGIRITTTKINEAVTIGAEDGAVYDDYDQHDLTENQLRLSLAPDTKREPTGKTRVLDR